MEAARAGHRLPTRPSDGLRARRSDDGKSSNTIPRSMARLSQSDKGASNHARSSIVSPGSPDRGASSSTARRLSNIPRVYRPPCDRQSKPLIESTAPSTSQSHIQSQPEAERSCSVRSLDEISRSGQKHNARPLEQRDLLSDPDISLEHAVALRSPSSRPSYPELGALSIRLDRELTESPQRIREHANSPKQIQPTTTIYPELDRYRNHQQPLHLSIPRSSFSPDLSLQTPTNQPFSTNSSQLSASSLSISTKLFDTPGPSIHSRDTTPTSIASQSPSFAVSARAPPLSKHRLQSPSLTRPPVSRRRTGSISNEAGLMSADPHGLDAVREALTSSSPSISSSPGQHRETENIQKPEMTSYPAPLGSPLSPSQQPPKPLDEKKQRGAGPSLRRRSRPLSKLETVPALKSSSLEKPLPAPPPKLSRTGRPTRDGASDQHPRLRSPAAGVPSSIPPRLLRNDRRSSEPPITDSVKGPSRLPQNKSLSLDQGSSVKRGHPMMRSAGDSKESLRANSSLHSRTSSSETRSSSTTRFHIFGFGKKTTGAPQGGDKVSTMTTVARKGPAAGTGHEGYGKVRTLRRQSASLNGLTNRIPSGNSVSSGKSTPVDKFLADRMNPVIIAGGTVIENQNAGSESLRPEYDRNASERPSTESKVDSVISSLSRMETQTTVWPSRISGGPGPGPASRRSSDSSDIVPKPATALRRTVQRFKSSSSDNPLRLPHIRNKDSMELTRMQSCNASILSEVSSALGVSPGKSKRSYRKWNLFGRSRNKSTPEIKSEQVSVTVIPTEKKPIAFYTIMDPADEEGEPMDVQTALRQAQVYTQSNLSYGGQSSEAAESRLHLMHSSPEIIDTVFPAQPSQELIAEAPAPAAPAAPAMISSSSSRVGRLARVGRIPPVVSSRVDATGPAFTFPALSASDLVSAHVADRHDINGGTTDSDPLRLPVFHPASDPHQSMVAETVTNDSLYEQSPEPPAMKEFLAFPLRKISDCTTYSSSTDSGHYSFAATAVIPKPDDPFAEDEIWDEYNDLLGFDTFKDPQSTTSSLGVPFPLETYGRAIAEGDFARLSAAWPLGRGDSLLSVPLQDDTPSSSPFCDDGTEGSILQQTKEKQTPADLRLSISGSHKTRESGSSTSSEEWSPSAQVNLRIGSMTVSKWLTFSHVLFSDIRHELSQETDTFQQPSILVIDGLGNDDWSYYAAESYPDSTVFNLSPRPAPTEPEDLASGHCLKPPNHHQVQYPSHLDKFPFASHSFNCVVFRFPAAAPESHYQNILQESRRVLKPEGFLEMSILDVDLNAVGHRTRRAIRQLKEQIHETSPESNLASTADLMVRLLGRTGFTSIRAARVGIPAASPIARSSVDGAAPKGSRADKKKTKVKVGDQPSLQEMMTCHGPAADESITNMVARVGRWWYSRCYEDAARSPTAGTPQTSIWNDRALLKECEELGTSLKLMVCCARSPKRTKSI